jgi:hypothetical protein
MEREAVLASERIRRDPGTRHCAEIWSVSSGGAAYGVRGGVRIDDIDDPAWSGVVEGFFRVPEEPGPVYIWIGGRSATADAVNVTNGGTNSVVLLGIAPFE